MSEWGSPAHLTVLRHALSASLDGDVRGVTLEVEPDGVRLGFPLNVLVRWNVLLEGQPGLGSTDMLRVVAGVRRWLLARLWVGQPLEMLTGSLMVVAMASGAVGHPGDTWTQESVPGGVLTLGVGVEGADPQHPDAVIAVPRSVWEHAGVSPEMLQGWWPVLRERHERLGGLCAERFLASPGHERALRGTGGHDVLTLLGSASLRAALAGSDGVGLVGVAVPTRAHGFLMNRMVDPAFLAVLTAAASAADVGVAGPVLVTRDEVVRVVQRRVALVSSALENALVVDVRQVGVVSFFA